MKIEKSRNASNGMKDSLMNTVKYCVHTSKPFHNTFLLDSRFNSKHYINASEKFWITCLLNKKIGRPDPNIFKLGKTYIKVKEIKNNTKERKKTRFFIIVNRKSDRLTSFKSFRSIFLSVLALSTWFLAFKVVKIVHFGICKVFRHLLEGVWN